MWCTSALSVVSQCKLVSGSEPRKWRSVPPHGPYDWGRTLHVSIIIIIITVSVQTRRLETENCLVHWRHSAASLSSAHAASFIINCFSFRSSTFSFDLTPYKSVWQTTTMTKQSHDNIPLWENPLWSNLLYNKTHQACFVINCFSFKSSTFSFDLKTYIDIHTTGTHGS